MRYTNTVKKVRGESVEYVRAIPENAVDCFELFKSGTSITKKEIDEANSALRPALEAFFTKASFVAADYLNRTICEGNEDSAKLAFAHEINAVKAFNGVQKIIFGSSAHVVDVLDMDAVKAFSDSFAVLFRGRFARVDLSAFSMKQFTLASFREACELFAGFETRRREGIAFESGAVIASAVTAKLTKNARKRAARAAEEQRKSANEVRRFNSIANYAHAEHSRTISERKNTFAISEERKVFAHEIERAREEQNTDAIFAAKATVEAARLTAEAHVKALEEPVA